MPRIKVTLADGSTKHVNMTRDQLVYYNATGKLDKDIVNQDSLMLPVLNKAGILDNPAVNTIKDVGGDLKDFIVNQDNIVSFLSSYKTVQEETNGIKMAGDAILMEVADNAPQTIKNKYYWSHTIKFDNKMSGTTTVDLLNGQLPPGFYIQDSSSNVMTNNTLDTISKSIIIYGTTDMTAVSDYIDSGAIDRDKGFIKHHPSELDTHDENRYIELMDIEYIDNSGNVINNPTNTFQKGDVIYSDNYQDNFGMSDGVPRRSRPITEIISYEDRNKTKTKFLIKEILETTVSDPEGNPVIIDGEHLKIKDGISFVNRDLQFALYEGQPTKHQRVTKNTRFKIIGQNGIRAQYYDTSYTDTQDRGLAKNYYFQLGIKYQGQSEYSDSKWFAIVCVNNYDGTRDVMIKTMSDEYLSEDSWLPIVPTGKVGDGGQEFDLQIYFSGDQPSTTYYWDGDVKNMIEDYILPFTDASGSSHQISVLNEILPFKYYSSTLVLSDEEIFNVPDAFRVDNGELEWELNQNGTKYYKTQQLESS